MVQSCEWLFGERAKLFRTGLLLSLMPEPRKRGNLTVLPLYVSQPPSESKRMELAGVIRAKIIDSRNIFERGFD